MKNEEMKDRKNFHQMGNKHLNKNGQKYGLDIASCAPTAPNQCIKALHDFVNPLSNKIAQKSKHEQPRRDAPEPIQVVDFLTGDQDVHAPEASYDVHW